MPINVAIHEAGQRRIMAQKKRLRRGVGRKFLKLVQGILWDGVTVVPNEQVTWGEAPTVPTV